MGSQQKLKETMSVGVMIVSVLWAIAIIISSLILWKELKKRKQLTVSSKRTNPDIISKYLRFTSLCTLFIVCTCCIFGFISGLPIICKYTLSLSIATRFISYLPMELYQLARLYYCFSNSAAHSKKAYPVWVFISVLLFAVILTIQLFSGPFIFYKSRIDSSMHHLCSTKYDEPEWPIFFGVAAVQLIICDWIILGLYIYKVRQIDNYHSTRNISQSGRSQLQYGRIKAILSRIILLTFCYEFAAFLTFCIFFASEFMWDPHGAIVASFGISFNLIAISYIMRLMLQHNTDEYNLFLNKLEKWKIFVICSCIKPYFEFEEDEANNSNKTIIRPHNNHNNEMDKTKMQDMFERMQHNNKSGMTGNNYPEDTQTTIKENESNTSKWDTRDVDPCIEHEKFANPSPITKTGIDTLAEQISITAF